MGEYIYNDTNPLRAEGGTYYHLYTRTHTHDIIMGAELHRHRHSECNSNHVIKAFL